MKARLAIVALGVSVLGACTSDGTNGEASVRRSDGYIDGPVFASPDKDNADGMDAEVTGEVTLDPTTGCLRLSNSGTGHPIVWPHGTTWQLEPKAVVLASGEVVPVGTSVYGGGGYLHRDGLVHVTGTEVADAALACAGPTGEVALFNLNSDVTVGSGPPLPR